LAQSGGRLFFVTGLLSSWSDGKRSFKALLSNAQPTTIHIAGSSGLLACYAKVAADATWGLALAFLRFFIEA
jgi:hypothetical protein